jgi:radical SAM superfamily enzyme YgiQ (UPF0313 family)
MMKVLILRLSNSRDTAASSTHQVLAELSRSACPDALIDFAFLPSKRAPAVVGVQSGLPWGAFDIILVSNSFVQEAINLPWLLAASNLSPWAQERSESFPPIVLGGSNAFAAQSLVCPDGRAVPDVLFFGEAEEMLPLFLKRFASSDTNTTNEGNNGRATFSERAAAGSETHALPSWEQDTDETKGNIYRDVIGKDRRTAKLERLLRATDGLDGFWVTGSLPEKPVRQALARDIRKSEHTDFFPAKAASLLLDVESAGTVRLTVSRGCPAFCSFCFEGYERKPYREIAAEHALRRARFLKREYGATTVELDAFNLNMYSDFVPLVKACAKLFDHLSFKSQRADGVAACPEIIDLERACGKQSFTLGIEGISARMRAFLCKSLTDEEIESALQALLTRRVREIKLFYILTGHEGPEDLVAFGSFCSRLRQKLQAPRCGTRVVLSFGRLVRMPNTPLMYDRLLLDEEEWRFCVDGVSAACRRAKLEFRFAFDWPDYVGTQLLAACGHEDAPAIVKLASEGLSYHGPWQASDAAKLQAVVAPPMGERNPFPFVKRTVAAPFLKERWKDACDYRDKGYCLGEACFVCGACSTPEEQGSLVNHPRVQEISDDDIEALSRLDASKRQLAPLYRSVNLPDAYAGHQAAYVNAELMRHLLRHHPDLMDNLLSVKEALFTAGENEARFPVPGGQTVVAFRAWDRKALVSTLAAAAPLIGKEVAPGFQPGAFSKASCLLHTALSPRDVAQSASTWLNSLHLPHTLCRADEGWRLDPAPAALKKKVLYTCTLQPIEGGTCVALDCSSKLPLREWLITLPRHATQPSMTCRSVDAVR